MDSDATGDASNNSAVRHKTAIKPQFYERAVHMSKECSSMPTYSAWLHRKILNPNRIDTNLYHVWDNSGIFVCVQTYRQSNLIKPFHTFYYIFKYMPEVWQRYPLMQDIRARSNSPSPPGALML